MYDVIIVGAGPAGMSAAIYLKRANKNVLILEKETIGGQMSSSPLVENYPGCISMSGACIANNMFTQVEELGIDFELEEVTSIKQEGNIKKVITTDNEYTSKAVIIATGAKYRLLGLDNEENLIGNGIHFCVACDGAFYKDKTVAVIGGGNSGVINAITLCDLCKKVYLIQNLNELTAEKKLQEQLTKKENIEILTNTKIKEIIGNETLEGLIIESNKEDKKLDIDGMFISIGLVPQNDFIKDLIDLDSYNYIKSDDTTTNIEGVFATGDCRTKKFRQITTAVNDGTIAALLAAEYLENTK